ncbi:hypothetical protein NC651_003912 [Populus alba x Populus x berolinensis]|nr:hypothetical protein NC651_003912 [Populus alba x Populus x berolinensis]
MTFETIAMDERLKEEIIGDLNTFVKSKGILQKNRKSSETWIPDTRSSWNSKVELDRGHG